MNMNKTIIIANWKMNPGSAAEAQELFETVAKGIEGIDGAEIVICPPFVYLSMLRGLDLKFQIGAQDCFWEEQGAFTGEVSANMLKDLGCSHVILGHSERKKYFGETEEMTQKKMKAALAAGLKVVLCIDDKEKTPRDEPNLFVVYEPEWAISSEGGEPADPKIVAAKIADMRATLQTTPILYGGSVDSSNIAMFLKETKVQGALVGSASLDADEFIALVKNAQM